jgi:3-phenylpropionate/trans-cinnamate dioxygenase ferredoxin reductase subunit
VLELDHAAHTAKLSTKEEVGFDRALIATGAMVRRLTVDGAQLEGIHYLRALGNADGIREEAQGADAVVCVGGSYIASEVAASLTELGKKVTMVMLEDHPLSVGFGATAGRYFRGVLEEHGVQVIGGDEVLRFEGEERVERVVTAGGRELAAQAVICGCRARCPTSCSPASPASPSASSAASCATAACARRPTGSTPPATCASTTRSCTGAWCASSTRRSPPRTGGRSPATCSGRRRPRRGPLLLLRPLRLGLARVRRPAFELGRRAVEGSVDDGAFAVWYREGDRVRAMLSVGGAGDLDRARELIKSEAPPVRIRPRGGGVVGLRRARGTLIGLAHVPPAHGTHVALVFATSWLQRDTAFLRTSGA